MADVLIFTNVAPMDRTQAVNGVARDQLRSIIERIERLNEEIKALNDDKKDVFGEAKGNGFNTNAIKRVVQLRAMDPNERAEFETIVDLYMHALGMAMDPEC